MPFPDSPRAVFRRNPLFTVSAQIRFPTILKVAVESPVAFQEAIRGEFPVYTFVNPSATAIPPEVPQEVQAAIRAAMMQNGLNIERAHRFSTPDLNWTVQLSQESIIMSCKVYPRWEIFREKLGTIFASLMDIYKPAYATAIGLRYQNAIQRKTLGLEEVKWGDLLQPFIAAELRCDGLQEKEIIANLHRFELAAGWNRVVVQHGLGTNQTTHEKVYSLDNNFSTVGKVDFANVFARFDELNQHSGSLFRHCITPRLFNALEPTEL